MTRFIFISFFILSATGVSATEPVRDQLYLVTTMRAAPGQLKALIHDLTELKGLGFYEDSRRTDPLIMRHSQGDQWDLMLLEPIKSYSAFFAKERMDAETETRRSWFRRGTLLPPDRTGRLAYRAELFAYGPSWEIVSAHIKDAKFFHIEMFDSAPDMAYKLVDQREMENKYLQATKRRGNLIFVGDMGTDVDVFTIGAYKNLQAFAARPDLPEGATLKAAKDAGFADDNSIGFYLRELISAHHDTLATLVE